jgi:hypothetical protein
MTAHRLTAIAGRRIPPGFRLSTGDEGVSMCLQPFVG